MIEIYQQLPQRIDPIAFMLGSFSVRWYGLAYLVGFLVVYLLLRLRILKGEFPIATSEKNAKSVASGQLLDVIFDLLLVAFFSALVGGRIGYVLFYNWTFFLAHPIAIVSPFNQEGIFVGLYGMSYHGALLGVIAGCFLFLKIRKQNFLAWADFVVAGVALGYFFGRVGNFLNGELYGRITTSVWGMYFPGDLSHLRHPSQLYEALLEGLLMFAILWKIRNKKRQSGIFLATYLFGYGLLRILIEQFREPDVQIGLLWNVFTFGQLLSAVMMIVGVLLFFLLPKKGKVWYTDRS